MFIIAQGINIYIERSGKGKPLLLIHGLGTPGVWMYARKTLSEMFDVITIHLPGFGLSEPAATPLSTHDHAKLLVEILNTLQLRNVAALGVSYGGQLAATLALMSTERIDCLILACSSGLMKRYRFLRYSLFRRIISTVAEYSVLRYVTTVRLMNRILYYDHNKQPNEIIHEFHRMISQTEKRKSWFQCVWNASIPESNFAENLTAIRIPTLILWGQNDRVIPTRYAYEFQQLIKGSTLIIFQECGHALPLERPKEMCEAIEKFLSSNR